MPPPPELGKALGDIGEVEVLGEVKAHHLAQADGHLGIAGKVKVNLEGIGRRSHPGQGRGDTAKAQGFGNLGPQRADVVGNQHLFPQAHDKHSDPLGYLSQIDGALLQLLGDIGVPDNGSGD